MMDEERGFVWLPMGIVIALAVGLSIWLLNKPSPTPPPANQMVFGCYRTAEAPPIMLDAEGMHVLQSDPTVVKFNVEQYKSGVVLATNRTIEANRSPNAYRIVLSERGAGTFLRFLNGTQLEQFVFVALDGSSLIYTKTTDASCAPRK